MKLIFADTLYWGAILHPHDQYRSKAVRARKVFRGAHLVTTDEVLTELLDGLGRRGPALRKAAAHAVHRILDDARVTVYPQSRDSFLSGLRLFEQRSDKGYSLVDCVSMSTMLREGITEILTNDYHFAQEGFEILLR